MSDPKVGTGKKPKGSGRRLYTDENPKDTVSVKFSTRQDIVDTLSKKSFKSVPRLWVKTKSLQFLRKAKMLSEEQIIEKLKKRINATLQQIGDSMITGGVDSMEKYKYMLGQAHAYQIVVQEISNLLKQDEKEQNDGNVIDIKGNTKN